MPNGYEQSLEQAKRYLDNADDLNGFVLAVQQGDSVATVKGNLPAVGEFDPGNALGALIWSVSQDLEMHPEDVGNAAIEAAIDMETSDEFSARENYDI